MFTIDFDLRPIEQLEKDLDRFGKRAMPYAIRDTLNTTAYKAAEFAKENIGRKFIERNSFTRRSIQYEKTFARDIDQMKSAVGSVQEYMAKQEEGFTRQKSGPHGVAIPTSAAAGQGEARVRTRRLQRRNWLSQVNPPKNRIRGPGRTVSAVREAIKSGKRVVFIDKRYDQWDRPTGFYRVLGGRKSARGWPTGAKLRMLYSVDKPSVRTEAHKWMDPSVDKVVRKFPEIYREAVIRQIEIQRCFRNRG
jgi:hypothetical protein